MDESTTQKFWITQPGSTVATSLSPGEAGDKFVGILEIRDDMSRMVPLKLNTRKFLHEDLTLDDYCERDVSEDDIWQFLTNKVCFISFHFRDFCVKNSISPIFSALFRVICCRSKN